MRSNPYISKVGWGLEKMPLLAAAPTAARFSAIVAGTDESRVELLRSAVRRMLRVVAVPAFGGQRTHRIVLVHFASPEPGGASRGY
jgi:hypothetical protein